MSEEQQKFVCWPSAIKTKIESKHEELLMNRIALRPINERDLALLTLWFNKNYILKWYHDADEWLHEIKERHGVFSWIKHFIVLDGETPIGFCQYYDCFYAKEDWYSVNKPHDTYSIDYLIGEESYLRKGYGKIEGYNRFTLIRQAAGKANQLYIAPAKLYVGP
jgi:RimJ/RimL family protein N-acetyltransferase